MTKKRILWIEDDYYAIQGLVWPLQNEGFEIDVAVSAVEGFHKARNWHGYSVIIVDLILPLTNPGEELPQQVESWVNEPYAGIGLVKWLRTQLRPRCPVCLLSVVYDPISEYRLEGLSLPQPLLKRALFPQHVREMVFSVLGTRQGF